MKQTLLFFALTLGAFVPSVAQVNIILVDEPGNSLNGDTVYVTSVESVFYPDMQVHNLSGSVLPVKWKRVKLSSSSPDFTDQLCDNQLCFDCIGNPWVRGTFLNIAADGYSIFQPKLNTNGISGTAHYRYYVMDGVENYIDSVDVIFTSTVSVEEAQNISYELYPNPANNLLNVKLNSNGNAVSIKVYNIMGELVVNEELISGNNTISVADLSDGVYFYSIIKNNAIVETKKVVIRH